MGRPIRQNSITRAALYMRLSRDDEQEGDSESIQNQRAFLREYANASGMVIAGEYVDDGWSGTNFKRPDFQRMLQDIEQGKINCVITKDLSRLGRNYIEVGRYTEYYFPEKNVRYIAVNDHVDTASEDNDVAPFLNIFNEFHAKQTSKKTRSVFESKFRNGAHCCCSLPYGYEKDASQKGRIVINEAQANIVRMIFDLADQGIGSIKIARYLYEQKIECPGYVLFSTRGYFSKIYKNAPENKKYEWNVSRIKKMLRDEIYIGNAVHYRERTASFKDRRTIRQAKDDWMIVPNTHDAIISEEQFFSVQQKMNARYRETSDGEVQIFSGIARCADCGKLLRFNVNRQTKGHAYSYLMCAGRKKVPDESCTTHYIRYNALKSCVLQNIQEIFAEFQLDRQAMLSRLLKVDESKKREADVDASRRIQELQTRRAELDSMLRRLYEDWGSSRITEENFNMVLESVQGEQKRIAAQLHSGYDAKKQADAARNAEKFADLIERLTYPKELTRELVNALIERIEVHESEGPRGARNKKQVIEIYYRFVGNVTL